MPRDLEIILDPPRVAYTQKDIVSGKVVLARADTERITGVYVFFRGCIKIEFTTEEETTNFKYMDKEVLFQKYQKLYEGKEKLLEGVRYEWPFKFDFQSTKWSAVTSASSLPTSGKYGRYSLCSV
jgi:hypothetical protein